MRQFFQFVSNAVWSQPGSFAAGSILTVGGVNYQDLLTRLIAAPPPLLTSHWVQLLLIAVGALFLAYVFYREAAEARASSDQINRLRYSPWAAFGDIASAVRSVNSAYNENQILDRLMLAAANGEFSSRSGHSQMLIAKIDENGHPTCERVPFLLSDLTFYCDPKLNKWPPGAVVVQGALFQDALGQTMADPVRLITISRRHFLRWYRRLKSGRYER